MKTLSRMLICLLVLFSAVVHSYAESKKTYHSPDRKLRAVVTTKGNNCRESKVEVYRRSELLVSDDHFSGDCEHGQAVDYAGWTKDSSFFLYIMYNTGGHQSWASSISFFDKKSRAISSFNKYLPPIADTKIVFKGKDYITVSIWTPFSSGLEGSIILPITFRMRDLVAGKETVKKVFPDGVE